MNATPIPSAGAAGAHGAPDATIIPGGDVIIARVWEKPIRAAHWIMYGAIVVLCVSGYAIGNPGFSSPSDASHSFTLGTWRFLHFCAGYVLLAAFLIRVYWGFVGNKFVRWSHMLPTTAARWQGIFEEVRSLLLPKHTHRAYTGHAPLANIMYLVAYGGVAFSLLSGFVLYSQAGYSPFWRFVAERGPVTMGNSLNMIHFYHHMNLWFFICYFMVHVYMVMYTMVVSRTTMVDTMVTGRKFVFRDDLSKFED